MKITNLNNKTLEKVYKRLKKNTKGFTSLIVRDSLDFLDFEVNFDKNLNDLIFDIKNSTYHPQKPYLHLSPKNKGINRPTVVFDIREAVVYRFCIEQIEKELLDKTRQKGIYGGIKISPKEVLGEEGFYEKWIEQWKEFLTSIEDSLRNRKFLVSTDIASYFENINILILKDLVRSDIEDKKEIINLLFYFLENISFRYDYETNTFTGLPQEDIDCSRVLAYYFLRSHDEAMIKFCKDNPAEFYRWVDDMNILVNSEVVGKKALKVLTESLRKLGLIASIEKTSIYDTKEARRQLFFEENRKLSQYENLIIDNLLNKKEGKRFKKRFEDYYRKLKRQKKQRYKNWVKILRRFYTLFSYTKSDILLKEINNHVIDFPSMFFENKLVKYLVRNQDSQKFNKCLRAIIQYLYSEENLYPSLESHLLELFLYFNPKKLSREVKHGLKKLSGDIFFSRNSYRALSDYARAVSCLLFFRFNSKNINKLAKHYIKSNESDFMLKKYLIFVAFTTENQILRNKVLEKAKKEQNLSINRFINFVENINSYKDTQSLRSYIKNNRIYIYKSDIFEEYKPIRVEILEKLIEIYSNK